MANLLTFVRFHHHLRAFTRVKVARWQRTARGRFTLQLFTRDALGRTTPSGTTFSEVSAFSICTFTRPVRQVCFTHRHSTTRLVLKLAISGIFAGPPLGGFPR